MTKWFFAAALLVLSTLFARAESQSMTKTVPAGASINYVVNGVVVQSMPLPPGTYRLTVETVDGVRSRPARGRKE